MSSKYRRATFARMLRVALEATAGDEDKEAIAGALDALDERRKA